MHGHVAERRIRERPKHDGDEFAARTGERTFVTTHRALRATGAEPARSVDRIHRDTCRKIYEFGDASGGVPLDGVDQHHRDHRTAREGLRAETQEFDRKLAGLDGSDFGRNGYSRGGRDGCEIGTEDSTALQHSGTERTDGRVGEIGLGVN